MQKSVKILETDWDRNENKSCQKKEQSIAGDIGVYASGLKFDFNKNKDYRLLILPTKRYSVSYNFLSRLDFYISYNDNDYSLSTCKFPSLYFPSSHDHFENFEMAFYPVTKFVAEDIEVAKSMIIPYTSNTILIRIEIIKAPKRILLKAIPYMTFMDVHNLSVDKMDYVTRLFFRINEFSRFQSKTLPPLFIDSSLKMNFNPSPEWWDSFEKMYENNQEFSCYEHIFSPGVFEILTESSQSIIFRLSTQKSTLSIQEEWESEIERILKCRGQHQSSHYNPQDM